MNRKKFISSAAPAAALLSSLRSIGQLSNSPKSTIIPPYLQPGDTIGITSPAGYISLEDIQPAIERIMNWGYTVKIGNAIGKKSFTLGGTDEERCNDFQDMLNQPGIKAILCARGGYGLMRIIDNIDCSILEKHPKWIIGFSDATVLHCHIQKNYGVATLHSKMCNSFPKDWSSAEDIQKATINSIYECLSGKKSEYAAPFNTNNKQGHVTGELIGGNLKTILSLIGTASEPDTKNKILFVEDTGEYLYSIDRMFIQLKRSGKLDHLKALIVGGFKIKKDDEGEAFGKTLEEIVTEHTKEFHFPVGFDFPVGHQKNNFALKCGIEHTLQIDNNGTILKEQAS